MSYTHSKTTCIHTSTNIHLSAETSLTGNEWLQQINEYTSLQKYKSLTLYFRKGDFLLSVRDEWRQRQTTILTEVLLLTIAALLSHLGWGCSTVGHWFSNWFSHWHSCLNCLTAAGTLSIFLLNANLLPLVFGLFTQVHLLIDDSVEGQFITKLFAFDLTLRPQNYSYSIKPCVTNIMRIRLNPVPTKQFSFDWSLCPQKSFAFDWTLYPQNYLYSIEPCAHKTIRIRKNPMPPPQLFASDWTLYPQNYSYSIEPCAPPQLTRNNYRKFKYDRVMNAILKPVDIK